MKNEFETLEPIEFLNEIKVITDAISSENEVCTHLSKRNLNKIVNLNPQILHIICHADQSNGVSIILDDGEGLGILMKGDEIS